MYYTLTSMPEHNVHVFTFQEGWDTPAGVEARAADIQRILREAQKPVFLVMDVSQVPITVEGVIRSSNRLARGPNAPFHHPMCKGVALVTTERIAQLIARGLQTETFGNLRVCVCDSVEEALEKAAKHE